MLYVFLALLSIGLGLLGSVCHQMLRQQRRQIDELESGKYFQAGAESPKGVSDGSN